MVSGPIPRRLLVLSFWVCSEQVPCFRRRCVERVPLAYAISGSSTLTAGVYLLLRVVWICEAACVSFVVRDLVQQQHVAIAALLVSCGALETAHAAAIHTDRLFILRRSVSGGTADPTRAERLLKPLRNGWVHELWCGNLMLVGMIFIAHPQLEPVNSQAICHLLLLLRFTLTLAWNFRKTLACTSSSAPPSSSAHTSSPQTRSKAGRTTAPSSLGCVSVAARSHCGRSLRQLHTQSCSCL